MASVEVFVRVVLGGLHVFDQEKGTSGASSKTFLQLAIVHPMESQSRVPSIISAG